MRPASHPLRLARLSACLTAALGIVATGANAVASTVTNCTDDDVDGTLRKAVTAAANNEVIDVSACSSITLTQGEIASPLSLTIAGPSSGATTTIDANHASRVFHLTNNLAYGYLTLSGLTVTGGYVVGDGSQATGGCILAEHVTLQRTVVSGCTATTDNSAAYGGAIQAPYMTMEDSRIENSTARTYAYGGNVLGGAVFSFKEFHCTSSSVSGNTSYAPAGSGDGGGVAALRIVTLDGCTFDSNTGRNGGGILHFGFDNTQTMTIKNSTVSGNTAKNSFGGVYSNQLLTITNSTITNNHAVYCGGAFVAAAAAVNSSIIAGNFSDNSKCVDLLAQSGVGGAHNLASVVNGTWPEDTIVANPLLTPLTDHGGPTYTHGLSLGSPAIDAGSNVDSVATDQRGLAREVNGTADIGAFERQADDDQLFYSGFD